MFSSISDYFSKINDRFSKSLKLRDRNEFKDVSSTIKNLQDLLFYLIFPILKHFEANFDIK